MDRVKVPAKGVCGFGKKKRIREREIHQAGRKPTPQYPPNFLPKVNPNCGLNFADPFPHRIPPSKEETRNLTYCIGESSCACPFSAVVAGLALFLPLRISLSASELWVRSTAP